VNDAPSFRTRLDEVRARIADAARKSGRDPRAVTLVAVIKTVPLESIHEAVRCGLADLGENRVQEARTVVDALGRGAARWHLIGHLQRNKTGHAAGLFDRIHSIDGPEVAAALSRHAVAAGRRLPALVQVNVSGESTKHGVAPEGAGELVRAAASLPGLAVDGLMTMAPYADDAAAARPHFARARALRDAIAREYGVALPVLSMGMSGDYEVAVEEGSTMVRIGTALFGARPRA
jgi:pyridoxal phosphate enzyme (YggS family)